MLSMPLGTHLTRLGQHGIANALFNLLKRLEWDVRNLFFCCGLIPVLNNIVRWLCNPRISVIYLAVEGCVRISHVHGRISGGSASASWCSLRAVRSWWAVYCFSARSVMRVAESLA